MWTKQRTADMEVIVEQAHTKCAARTARIAQTNCDLPEFMGKLGLLEHCNYVPDSRYSKLSYKWDLPKR